MASKSESFSHYVDILRIFCHGKLQNNTAEKYRFKLDKVVKGILWERSEQFTWLQPI
jgi:hypothetical protein